MLKHSGMLAVKRHAKSPAEAANGLLIAVGLGSAQAVVQMEGIDCLKPQPFAVNGQQVQQRH